MGDVRGRVMKERGRKDFLEREGVDSRRKGRKGDQTDWRPDVLKPLR